MQNQTKGKLTEGRMRKTLRNICQFLEGVSAGKRRDQLFPSVGESPRLQEIDQQANVDMRDFHYQDVDSSAQQPLSDCGREDPYHS